MYLTESEPYTIGGHHVYDLGEKAKTGPISQNQIAVGKPTSWHVICLIQFSRGSFGSAVDWPIHRSVNQAVSLIDRLLLPDQPGGQLIE